MEVGNAPGSIQRYVQLSAEGDASILPYASIRPFYDALPAVEAGMSTRFSRLRTSKGNSGKVSLTVFVGDSLTGVTPLPL